MRKSIMAPTAVPTEIPAMAPGLFPWCDDGDVEVGAEAVVVVGVFGIEMLGLDEDGRPLDGTVTGEYEVNGLVLNSAAEVDDPGNSTPRDATEVEDADDSTVEALLEVEEDLTVDVVGPADVGLVDSAECLLNEVDLIILLSPVSVVAEHCPVKAQYWPTVQHIGSHGDSPVSISQASDVVNGAV